MLCQVRPATPQNTSDDLDGLSVHYNMRLAPPQLWRIVAIYLALWSTPATASLGDRLPDFKECVKVCNAGPTAVRERSMDSN